MTSFVVEYPKLEKRLKKFEGMEKSIPIFPASGRGIGIDGEYMNG